MIYHIHLTDNRIRVYSIGEVAEGAPSFRSRIIAKSKTEAIFLYVAELERQAKDHAALLSLTQKLAERNAYLEQAITSHLATIEQIRAVVRSECGCTLKKRMVAP
jgi:hypothetical protein